MGYPGAAWQGKRICQHEEAEEAQLGWGLLMVLLTLAEYFVCHNMDASCVLLQLQGLDSDI